MPFEAPILYVEDDPGFVDHLAFTLQKIGCTRRLVNVPNGEEAIAYLSHRAKYADKEKHPVPGLILLDLRMARTNGFDVLQWIRSRSEVPWMTVVVVTVSEEIEDVKRAYQLGAQSFIIKPVLAKDLQEMIRAWEAHWLRNTIPFMTDDPKAATVRTRNETARRSRK